MWHSRDVNAFFLVLAQHHSSFNTGQSRWDKRYRRNLKVKVFSKSCQGTVKLAPSSPESTEVRLLQLQSSEESFQKISEEVDMYPWSWKSAVLGIWLTFEKSEASPAGTRTETAALGRVNLQSFVMQGGRPISGESNVEPSERSVDWEPRRGLILQRITWEGWELQLATVSHERRAK